MGVLFPIEDVDGALVAERGEEVRHLRTVSGGRDHGSAAPGEGLVQCGVAEVEQILAADRIDRRRLQFGLGDEGRQQRASAAAEPVEGVVDVVDEVGGDPLVQGALLAADTVAQVIGQGAEVVGVFGGGHFEGELRVLHGEEPRRAGHPVQSHPAVFGIVDEIPVDLGGRLAAADDRDRPGFEQGLAVVEVVGGVDERADTG